MNSTRKSKIILNKSTKMKLSTNIRLKKPVRRRKKCSIKKEKDKQELSSRPCRQAGDCLDRELQVRKQMTVVELKFLSRHEQKESGRETVRVTQLQHSVALVKTFHHDIHF